MSDSSATRQRRPGRPSAAERPEARNALLDAAGQLFAHHGAGAVSLRRIADEAGVTPAMVHYYFGDKEGLYDAIFERTFGRVIERVRLLTGPGRKEREDADGRLAELLRVLTSVFAEEPWIPAVLVREVLADGGRFRERFIRSYASQMAELLPELIRSEIDAGRFREDLDPQLAFLSFMGMAVFPFAARPVAERVLGVQYDEDFLERFAAHTQRLFMEGVQS